MRRMEPQAPGPRTRRTPKPVLFTERSDRPLDERIRRIEASMQTIGRSRRRWRFAFGALAVALVLVTSVGFAAFTAQQDNFDGLQGNTIAYDENTFSVTVIGHLVSLGETAAGTTSGSPVEMSDAVTEPQATTGASIGDWVYIIVVEEASEGAPGTVDTFKAELFADGTSKGALYFDNSVEGAGLDSVELRWDLDASLPATQSYVVKISTV